MNLCKCGCGQEISKIGNIYVHGHNNKGKKIGPMSEDRKRKIGECNKRRIISETTREKLSKALSGENNPNWKGGISCEPYCDVWLNKEYKDSIKERDGYKCLNTECNGKYKRLHLHHINYIKKDCHPLNLITLCISCNTKANKDRDWHQSWYQAIINRRYN